MTGPIVSLEGVGRGDMGAYLCIAQVGGSLPMKYAFHEPFKLKIVTESASRPILLISCNVRLLSVCMSVCLFVCPFLETPLPVGVETFG